MESTNKLTESQQKAIAIVQKLVDDGKIDFSDAFQLIVAIYENKPEFIYVPYTSPWIEPYRPYTEPWITTPKPNEPYTIPTTTPWPNVPWWDNQITCRDGLDTAASTSDGKNSPRIYAYGIQGSYDPIEWITNSWIG